MASQPSEGGRDYIAIYLLLIKITLIILIIFLNLFIKCMNEQWQTQGQKDII